MLELRASSIASIKLCRQRANIHFHGYQQRTTTDMLLGTLAHSTQEFLSLNNSGIIKSIRELPEQQSLFDTIYNWRLQAVEFALKRLEDEGWDKVTMAKIAYKSKKDAESNAHIDAQALKEFKDSWTYYQMPEILFMENRLDVNINLHVPEYGSIEALIYGHPDLVFRIPDDDMIVLLDYKNGRVAPVNKWVHEWERLQLNIYSWLLKAHNITNDLNVIFYLQALGSMFDQRYFKVNTAMAEETIAEAVQYALNIKNTEYSKIWFCNHCDVRDICRLRHQGHSWEDLEQLKLYKNKLIADSEPTPEVVVNV